MQGTSSARARGINLLRRPSLVRRPCGQGRLAWRPGTPELLEARIAPASNLLLAGGLEFLASANFNESAGDYSLAPGDSVSVGYAPIGTENFRPLVRFDLGADATKALFSVAATPTESFFTVQDVKMSVVAVHGEPVVPIPVWQTGPSDANPVKFVISQLLSTNGLSLNPADAVPITVAHSDFTLSTLYFNKPSGDTTSDCQVEMQGALDLSHVPVIGRGSRPRSPAPTTSWPTPPA